MNLIDQSQIWQAALPVYRIDQDRLRFDRHLYGRLKILEPVTYQPGTARCLDLAHNFGANYGHWIHDLLPQLLLCRTKGIPVDSIKVHPNALQVPHVVSWTDLLEVDRTADDVECFKLNYPLSMTSLVHPSGLKLLRDFLSLANETYTPEQNRILLVQRCYLGSAPTESRNWEERQEFLRLTRDLPVEVVYLEDTTIFQQMALFNSAKAIIGVHGTGLSNVVFCRPGTAVIEIRSPLFWNCTYADIASYLGLRYLLIGGNERHGNRDLHRHCVSAPARAVEALLREQLELC
jgi:capsular polysaccharide biosynthesis protein